MCLTVKGRHKLLRELAYMSIRWMNVENKPRQVGIVFENTSGIGYPAGICDIERESRYLAASNRCRHHGLPREPIYMTILWMCVGNKLQQGVDFLTKFKTKFRKFLEIPGLFAGKSMRNY